MEKTLLTKEILLENGFSYNTYMRKEFKGIEIEICLDNDIPMYVRCVWVYCLPHPTYVEDLLFMLKMIKDVDLDEFVDNFKF